MNGPQKVVEPFISRNGTIKIKDGETDALLLRMLALNMCTLANEGNVIDHTGNNVANTGTCSLKLTMKTWGQGTKTSTHMRNTVYESKSKIVQLGQKRSGH